MKRDKEELVGCAVQLAYEYPEFGCDHLGDMYDTYAGKAPFDFDEFGDVAQLARNYRNDGLSYHDTMDKLMIEID